MHSPQGDTWDMPPNTHGVQSSGSSTLTWQQQLLAAKQPSRPTEKKKPNKKDHAAKKQAQNSPLPVTKNEDGLTWQQELFNSNKPRGPVYDVFADAKDAVTFGGVEGHAGAGHHTIRNTKGGKKSKRSDGANRQRADSLSGIESRANHAATNKKSGAPQPATVVHLGGGSSTMRTSSSSSGFPSTPDKLAYAGPSFHNSPSPAALPMPKFLQSKGNTNVLSPSVSVEHSSPFAREARQQQDVASSTSLSSNDDDSHEEEEEEDQSFSGTSYARGATAPPDLAPTLPVQSVNGNGTNDTHSMTIENLLAKMMQS